MKTLTIYFPAVGGEPTIAAAATLRATWPGPEELRIVGSDVDANSEAKVALDEFIASPPRDDQAYLEFLLMNCRRLAVDVLWPNPPEEQLFVQHNRAAFEASGIKLILGSVEGLRVFTSKQQTYEQASRLGIPVPNWSWANDWQQLLQGSSQLGYPDRPLIFRPVVGKGAFGVMIVSADRGQAARSLFGNPTALRVMPLASLEPILKGYTNWPTSILCEFLPGREYEVDCFCDADGLKYGVVREHHAMWGGTAQVAEVVDRPDLVELCATLLGSVAWQNICSVQFKENKEGIPTLIEVNPRMASNVGLPVEAGVDLPLLALLKALGRPKDAYFKHRIGVRSVRYLSQGFLDVTRKSNHRYSSSIATEGSE
jgi:carbamoyl-phosphate synthase large subunit